MATNKPGEVLNFTKISPKTFVTLPCLFHGKYSLKDDIEEFEGSPLKLVMKPQEYFHYVFGRKDIVTPYMEGSRYNP